jgi:predicted metal-binding membrane protein
VLGAFRTPEDDRWYRLALGALVLSAWLVLGVWGASPSAHLLTHREIGADTPSPIFRLGAFVVGWTIMTLAMMLPASLPLVNLFRTTVAFRPDRDALLVRLGAGYLGVWAAFGAAAYAGDLVVHEAVERVALLQAAARMIPAMVVLAAGVYQFTGLKEKCLAQCRSPYAFLVLHWQGRSPARESWRLGARHGLFCVGCCWTLMLMMFAVGVGHLGWMLALGAVMASERATRWGRKITRPVGAALVLWAVVQLVLAGGAGA